MKSLAAEFYDVAPIAPWASPKGVESPKASSIRAIRPIRGKKS